MPPDPMKVAWYVEHGLPPLCPPYPEEVFRKAAHRSWWQRLIWRFR